MPADALASSYPARVRTGYDAAAAGASEQATLASGAQVRTTALSCPRGRLACTLTTAVTLAPGQDFLVLRGRLQRRRDVGRLAYGSISNVEGAERTVAFDVERSKVLHTSDSQRPLLFEVGPDDLENSVLLLLPPAER